MKYAQFFETVAFTRAHVVAIQDGEHGYKLVARLAHQDDEGQEDTREMTLESTDGPRYFKSLSALPDILRESKITRFSVQLAPVEVKAAVRGPRGNKPAAAKTPAAKKTTGAQKETAPA